jgi:ribosomal protein S21
MIVARRENENVERLLGRFKRVVERSGVLRDARRKRHFVSKSEAKRVAKARAIRRIRKNAAKAVERNSYGGRPSRNSH